jgi:hypothetical protein
MAMQLAMEGAEDGVVDVRREGTGNLTMQGLMRLASRRTLLCGVRPPFTFHSFHRHH